MLFRVPGFDLQRVVLGDDLLGFFPQLRDLSLQRAHAGEELLRAFFQVIRLCLVLDALRGALKLAARLLQRAVIGDQTLVYAGELLRALIHPRDRVVDRIQKFLGGSGLSALFAGHQLVFQLFEPLIRLLIL